MKNWITVYQGRDKDRDSELKTLLDNGKIKYRARAVNAKQPAGAGVAGAGTATRTGLIFNGASETGAMSDPAWSYTIEIRAADLPRYRALVDAPDDAGPRTAPRRRALWIVLLAVLAAAGLFAVLRPLTAWKESAHPLAACAEADTAIVRQLEQGGAQLFVGRGKPKRVFPGCTSARNVVLDRGRTDHGTIYWFDSPAQAEAAMGLVSANGLRLDDGKTAFAPSYRYRYADALLRLDAADLSCAYWMDALLGSRFAGMPSDYPAELTLETEALDVEMGGKTYRFYGDAAEIARVADALQTEQWRRSGVRPVTAYDSCTLRCYNGVVIELCRTNAGEVSAVVTLEREDSLHQSYYAVPDEVWTALKHTLK